MSYTDIRYYLHQVDYLTPRTATEQLHNSHAQRHQAARQVSQYDRPFLSPLPMPSPTSCWYPQQDVQIGYSYRDPACPIQALTFSAPRPSLVSDPQPPDPPDWQCDSTDPVMSDLEPNLSMAALVSQLERLTADIDQLVSRMDAKERCLGDSLAATFSVHQPLRSASHDSAAPYTVQPHINPDIAGSLHQPPTQRSLPCCPPCSHDIWYGSIESLPNDIDAHESVQSLQIHYVDILSDQLLNRDPLGDDEVLLEVEEFMQVANEKQFSLDLSNVIAQVKDVIDSSVEGSFYMELIVKEVDRGFGRNGSDKKSKYADNIGKHDTVGISHCSTTLDTDARLIPRALT